MIRRERLTSLMLQSSLCDYSDPYILVEGRITNMKQELTKADERKKGIIFKNCASFTAA